jgi:hypothetical protein
LNTNLASLTFISFIIFSTLACLSHRNNRTEIPDWYINKPQYPGYLCGAGVLEGLDLGLTRAGAVALAKDDIASQLRVTFNSVIESDKNIDKNGGAIDQFRKWTTQVISETLMGCETVDEIIYEKDSKYKVYVLSRMPISNIQRELEHTVKDPALLTNLKNMLSE